MRCSYCIQEAEFKCGCLQPYMCETHLETHKKTLGEHKFELLGINLDQSRLQMLKSETFKRIKKINEAKKLIAYSTESLIKTIEKAHKEAIKRLDNLRKIYFEILEHKKFCTSELPIIENIETIELEVKTVELYQIMNQVENAYGVELIYYFEGERFKKEKEERRKKEEEEEERLRKEKEERNVKSNRYIEMSLKEKIDYYHPIVLKFRWHLNIIQSWGKELLVSNDGKYLFLCKPHLGI